VSCQRAHEFLERNKIESGEVVDARKTSIAADEALKLLKDVDQIYVGKGKKLVHFDLTKDKPDKETLLAHIIGPTGNLRAPTIRRGKTLIVGFVEDAYSEVLK
jgi:arsenate reductase-like glutaredoxin family protein